MFLAKEKKYLRCENSHRLDCELLSKFIIRARKNRGLDHAQPPEWN
jgi:hypothetical protein